MSARRRRVGSESEHVPIIIPSNIDQRYDSYDKHEGKLKIHYPLAAGVERSEPSTRPLPQPDTMAARDRTMEFARAVQSLQSRNIKRIVRLQDPRKATSIRNHGEFMLIARTVGRNIASTYAKLEKLTLLARNKSPFSEGPSDIGELTYIIKEDLNSLNKQIARLQGVAKEQKSIAKGSRQHILSHATNVVLNLQSKLANMSNEFKQVLEVSTESLKIKKSRQEKFDASAVVAARGSKRQQGSLLVEDQVNIDLDSQNGAMVPLLQSQKQLSFDKTDDYLQSRADAMQNIESTIVELGGIFQQLATMVHEQEEMVQRIDSNVDVASLNVEAAHTEILKYFQSVTSNRWLMIKIFGVLIMFFLFFVVFLS